MAWGFVMCLPHLPSLSCLGRYWEEGAVFFLPEGIWNSWLLFKSLSGFYFQKSSRHTPELSLKYNLVALISVPSYGRLFESTSLRALSEHSRSHIRRQSEDSPDEFSISPLLPLGKEKQCSNTGGHHSGNLTQPKGKRCIDLRLVRFPMSLCIYFPGHKDTTLCSSKGQQVLKASHTGFPTNCSNIPKSLQTK